MPSEAGGAWSVFKSNGKQLVSVLKAWDAETQTGVCSHNEFRRAAQACGALGLVSRIPTDVELDSMFDHMVAGNENKDVLPYEFLLRQPLEPATFEVIEEEEFDPDDCFEGFGDVCMACGSAPEPNKRLLACQKCKKVKYCSRACQLTGWRLGHKESCGKRPMPTPSKVTGGGPAQVCPLLSEFHACNGSVAFACMSRLGALALDPDTTDKTLRGIVDWPGGVAAIVKAMRCYEGHRELILPGYMLLCALSCSSKEGAIAVVQAEGIEPLIDLLKVSVNEPHLLFEGVRAMKMMAMTGPTAKQQLIDKQGVFGIVWAMREHQDDVPINEQAIGALENIAYRGGIDIRKYVIFNSGVEGVCAVMRKHVNEMGKNAELALRGVSALRMMVAGDESGVICGTAADLAHQMTTAMTKYLGVECVVDAMMYHQENEAIQENGSAVIANIASVDLGAKRQHEVKTGSIVADTQATKNLIDSLIPVGKAIRRFPRLPSPRHALHVLVANLGSPQEALDAGCDLDWLPPELQWQKDEGENL